MFRCSSSPINSDAINNVCVCRLHETVSGECLLGLRGDRSAWLWSSAEKSESGINWERQNPLANTDSWHRFGPHTPLTPRALSTEPISCCVSRAVTQNARPWLGRACEARPSFQRMRGPGHICIQPWLGARAVSGWRPGC